jgi:hypothetical protein
MNGALERIVGASTSAPAYLRSKHSALLAGLLVLFAITAPGRADFIVLDGNNPEPDEENILLPEDDIGLTIFGSTQSGKIVSFTSPTQYLIDPAGGQANIEARAVNDANSAQVAIDDSITVALTDPSFWFRDLIFNAFIGGNLGDGGSLSIIVNGFDGNGDPASETITLDEDSNVLTLGNGQNFYTVLATDGYRMTSVEISPNTDSSYADLRQVRISGAVPEPASALLCGLAMLAMMCGYRPKRS